MLHVTFHELTRRGAQQLLACCSWHGQVEGQAVLQLIPETIGATRLVKGRSGPKPTRYGLIQKPAIQEDVHRAVGSLHLYGAQYRLPMGFHLFQHLIKIGLTIAHQKFASLIRSAALPEKRYDVHGLA